MRLPPELTDEEATPVNCGVATMVAATEAAAITIGDAVVVANELPKLPHLELEMIGQVALAKAKEARLAITGG